MFVRHEINCASSSSGVEHQTYACPIVVIMASACCMRGGQQFIGAISLLLFAVFSLRTPQRERRFVMRSSQKASSSSWRWSSRVAVLVASSRKRLAKQLTTNDDDAGHHHRNDVPHRIRVWYATTIFSCAATPKRFSGYLYKLFTAPPQQRRTTMTTTASTTETAGWKVSRQQLLLRLYAWLIDVLYYRTFDERNIGTP